ncbi:MAG: hypothetical protein COV10_04285 [Candidatus Vogelbacteria bacterium CG10_big_fil_rev_8_21_14_0_10_51_16]|uniref:Uncharacterized protein n=1 Tax=Candidatus Vogelbacteria bacterium CG10_big_fil_rev_8_21_14_0_10_51_16 TaxID=1975045 RepID=A0A2H0RDE8_9BACT|nr:MAG: hypothetical protein COV10_04285 [Candidatus Vogelbacteria bacterium CG10_big_fil_rev_8_21_14_0_10_51_16]
MTTLTIPKELMRKKELVLVPRDEYEWLVSYQASFPAEIELSPAGRKALIRARKNIKSGKTLSVHELKQKLGY